MCEPFCVVSCHAYGQRSRFKVFQRSVLSDSFPDTLDKATMQIGAQVFISLGYKTSHLGPLMSFGPFWSYKLVLVEFSAMYTKESRYFHFHVPWSHACWIFQIIALMFIYRAGEVTPADNCFANLLIPLSPEQ